MNAPVLVDLHGGAKKKYLMSAVQDLTPLCASDIVLLICIFASRMLTAGDRTSW